MQLGLFVCDGNPNAPGADLADKFYHVDLKDLEGLTSAAEEIKDEYGLDGVLTVGTDFSASVAWVAEQCGLPGIGYQNARNASRKHLMRDIFTSSGIASPGYVELDRKNFSDAQELCSKLTYPLVVKPVDNMGARGVMEATGPSSLVSAISMAFSHSREEKIIIEEKIHGAEYSLDALVDGEHFFPLGIARRHIDYPPYFIERGHDFPSGMSKVEESKMFSTLARAAAELGISSGAVKGDIFYTPAGEPVIGEVAARLSGGYMSGWTYPLYSGVQPAIGALLLAMGEPLGGTAADAYLRSCDGIPSAERGLISIPGTVDSVHLCLPEGYTFSVSEKGDIVRFPQNNVEKCGNTIISGTGEQLEEALASSFIRLQSRNHAELTAALQDQFPVAYPALCQYLDALPANTEGHKQFSSHTLALPEDIRLLPGRDWAYRSLDKTLGMLGEFFPRITYKKDICPDPSVRSLLYCLGRAGLQAGVYFLDLYFSDAENIVNLIKELGHAEK